MKSIFPATLVLSLLLLAFGCSKAGPTVVPVKGVATRHGQPIKNLFISFTPEEGHGSWGLTNDDGHFELKYTKEQKGAIVGTHKVVVAFRARNAKEEMEVREGTLTFHPDQEAILEKYGKKDTTQMSVDITKDTQDLELKFD